MQQQVHPGVAVTKGFQYDVYNIEFTDLVTYPGVASGVFAKSSIYCYSSN